jgi:uncharacterized protein YbjT (DUF2867 family)
MNRVAIFGATSTLGQELVTAALNREFLINAVVVDPRKMTRQHEAITTIQVDLATGAGLEAAVLGCHFVIWAIVSRRSIVAEGLRNLAAELGRHRVPKRLVFISRMGITPRDGAASWFWGRLRWLPAVPSATTADLSRAEAILRAGSLTYLIVRPSGLSDGAHKRRLVAVGPHDPVPRPTTRAELADFVIGMLEEDVWGRGELVVGGTDVPRADTGSSRTARNS